MKQGDCDENNSDISEGALEVCDLSDVDENCNGLADDDDDSVTGAFAYYGDSDNDGFGDEDIKTVSCDGGAASGSVNFVLLYLHYVEDTEAILADGTTPAEACVCPDENCSIGCRLLSDPTASCTPIEGATCRQSNSP